MEIKTSVYLARLELRINCDNYSMIYIYIYISCRETRFRHLANFTINIHAFSRYCHDCYTKRKRNLVAAQYLYVKQVFLFVFVAVMSIH